LPLARCLACSLWLTSGVLSRKALPWPRTLCTSSSLLPRRLSVFGPGAYSGSCRARDTSDAPCYVARGRFDDGFYVSIEHSSGYRAVLPIAWFPLERRAFSLLQR